MTVNENIERNKFSIKADEEKSSGNNHNKEIKIHNLHIFSFMESLSRIKDKKQTSKRKK